MISVPCVFWGRGKGSLNENRAPSSFPTCRTLSQECKKNFEQWFEDGLGLRTEAIQGLAWTRFQLGDSSSEEVVRGAHGWLFKNVEPFDYFRNRHPFSAAELDRAGQIFQKRNDWLKQRAVTYLVVLVPDPWTLYPEGLPAYLSAISSVRRSDQIRATLEHRGVPVLDLVEALKKAKSGPRLYHQTDSHWNDVGAFVGYRAIGVRLKERFHQLEPRELDEFVLSRKRTQGRDLAVLLGLQKKLEEEELALTPSGFSRAAHSQTLGRKDRLWTNPDATLPTAVVFGDSYFEALAPFLAEHFSRLHSRLEFNFDPELVESEHPTLVIQEILDRKFSYLSIDEDPRLATKAGLGNDL